MLLPFVSVLLISQAGGQPDSLSTFIVMDSDNLGFGRVNITEAIQLAHSFAQMANFPEDSRGRYYQNRIIIDDQSVAVIYRSRVHLNYRHNNGSLFAFGITPPKEGNSPNKSLEECVARFRDFYSAAGFGTALVLSRAFDNDSLQFQAFFDYTVPGTDYKFASGVRTIMERTFGTPHHVWIGSIPRYELPSQVTASETALAVAAATTMLYTGWTAVSPAADEPKLTIPDFRNLPNRMRAVDHRRARERKAALTYEVTVKDAMAQVQAEEDRPFVQVYVDAESGEVLALEPVYALRGHLDKPVKHAPFKWSGEVWTVGAASGSVRDVLAKAVPKGKRVLLRQGKKRVLASFDSRTSLLWVRSNGIPVAGEPGPHLRSALLKSKPIAQSLFKVPANQSTH